MKHMQLEQSKQTINTSSNMSKSGAQLMQLLVPLSTLMEKLSTTHFRSILNNFVPNLSNNSAIKEKTNKRRGKLCELGNYNKRAPTRVVTQRMTSISYRGPTLFNVLPRYVRDKECSSVDQFKRVLDRFLTNVPDQPKIPHYSNRALSNSIPDQLALMRADGNFMDSPPHDTLYPVPFTGEG
ncbi:hypothetical protein Pcinc_027613 [Petrolisthes cinctipes]|uniref:Uncharacterized protein n=1 Tax=Petrolisthes cinctipes TaxID=88211 RepID=A0AAE1F5N1_PETCI|nr:hypothetical protein Pcinc_027613 [Petrolisthes cinctipes]